MKTKKEATGFTTSPEIEDKLTKLMDHFGGSSKSAVIRQAITLLFSETFRNKQ